MPNEKRELKSSVIEKHTSYVMAVPKNQADISTLKKVIDRLRKSTVLEFVGMKNLENPIIHFKYKDEVYQAEIFLENPDIPKLYSISHKFSEEEFETLTKAEKGITVGLVFGIDVMESYHMQIKLLNCLVPDILGIVDFSAMKIISGKWAELAAKSEVPPSPDYLYSVHAVNIEKEDIWLHSHGLNRCGIIEFEILKSTEENYMIHYNVINALANMGISEGKLVDEEEPKFVIDFGEDCMVVTWVDWMYALSLDKDIKNGGIEDREEAHNQDTGVIFTYLQDEDYKKKKFTHISVYDEMLQDNPLIMYPEKETKRMKALAMERFDVFAKHFNDEDNEGAIKFGIVADDEYQDKEKDEPQKEHIWFNVIEVNGDKIRATLSQEPYYLNDYHEGEEYMMDISQITDWIIYTKEDTITPDSIYVFE